MATLGNERTGATVLPFQALFEREMKHLLALVRHRGLNRDPVVRQRVAKAWAGLRIMGFNNDRLLGASLQGSHPGPESSIGKLFWANWHRDFGELAVDLMGPSALVVGDGFSLDPMQHTFLNSRAETIYGGANEIQRNIVGERVLGLPKQSA